MKQRKTEPMPEGKGRPVVYLAGPDVFLPDAREIGEAKRQICENLGLVGLFPLDNEIDIAGLPAVEQARRISLANEALMHHADAAIANLTPFRGASMDAGTAYEIGFIRALGRPVFAYTNSARCYAERAALTRRSGPAPDDFDAADVEIENFGLAENLMIAIAVSESGAPIALGSAPADLSRDLRAFQASAEAAAQILLGPKSGDIS